MLPLLVRRLATALVSLVALAVGLTVAVGSLGPTGRAHAATVRPHAATVRPLAAAVRAHPLPPLPAALRNEVARLQHPAPARALRAITPRALTVPGVGGTTCYVAGNGCSIHPCVQFVTPSAGPAVTAAQPAVAVRSAVVTVTATARTQAPGGAPGLRGQCRSVAGPTVSLLVGAVRVGSSGRGALSLRRPAVTLSR